MDELQKLLERERQLQPPLPPPPGEPPLSPDEQAADGQKRKREEKEKKEQAEKAAPAESQQLKDPEALRKIAESSSNQKRQYLVIAHEDASKLLKGKKGFLSEIKEEKAEFFGMDSNIRKHHCPAAWIHYISELEAKTASISSKKQCTHMNGELAKDMYFAFTFKDTDKVPPNPNYELWSDQVDAGLTEFFIGYFLFKGLW